MGRSKLLASVYQARERSGNLLVPRLRSSVSLPFTLTRLWPLLLDSLLGSQPYLLTSTPMPGSSSSQADRIMPPASSMPSDGHL